MNKFIMYPSIVLCCLIAAISAAQKPNIIVIMADDVGYGDVSCYGAKAVNTPAIDDLAANGLRFTSGYCSASTCTPTRYSMLTGRYAFRDKGTGIAPPNSPAIIKEGTTTVASILQAAGYQTAVVGKWHLGLGEKKNGPDWNGILKPGPLEIGFDTCFLLPTTNDRVPQVYVHDHRVANLDPTDPLWVGEKKPNDNHPTGKTHRDELKMDWAYGHNGTIHNGISRIGFYSGGNTARFRDEDLADKWIERSNEFIETNRDKPFFLFFASHDNHVPRMPHKRFQGKSELGFRGDAIVELDWCVGQLMATLKRLGLEENTLVVFCSDNGPVLNDGYKDDAIAKNGDHRAAGVFSGGKYSVYEGGTRTPFITRWPGRIEPGTSDKIVCTIDFAASFAALVGKSLASDQCVDSFNVLPALLGQPNASGRQYIVQQNNGAKGTYAIRDGDWKLLRHDREKTYNLVLTDRRKRSPIPRFQLFNLRDDPAEKNDLLEQEIEIGERLKKKLQAIIDAGRSRPNS